MTKSIKERMNEIVEQTKELERLVNEPFIASNKIWVPGKGIVTLWEVTNKQYGRS